MRPVLLVVHLARSGQPRVEQDVARRAELGHEGLFSPTDEQPAVLEGLSVALASAEQRGSVHVAVDERDRPVHPVDPLADHARLRMDLRGRSIVEDPQRSIG